MPKNTKSLKKNNKRDVKQEDVAKQIKLSSTKKTKLSHVKQTKSSKPELEAEKEEKEVKILDASVESCEDIDSDSDFAEISNDELTVDSDENDDIGGSSDDEDNEMDLDCIINEDEDFDIDSDAISQGSVEVENSEDEKDVIEHESENKDLDSEVKVEEPSSIPDNSAKKDTESSEPIDTEKNVDEPASIPAETVNTTVIDESTEEGKFMKEIHDRKTLFNKRVVFVCKLHKKQNVDKLLAIVPDCAGSNFKTSNDKRYINTGNGFLYFSSPEEAVEAIEKINAAKLNKGRVIASINKNSRILNNFKNVNLVKLIGVSNGIKDITAELKAAIGNDCEVVKEANGYYEITMNNPQDAFVLFKEKVKKIDNSEVLLNYSYELKNTFENNVLPTLPVVGQKRSMPNSDSNSKAKKFKGDKKSKK